MTSDTSINDLSATKTPPVERTDLSAWLIGAARDLAPVLQERAAQADRDRRVPDSTFNAFLDLGLLNVLKPARYGGFELGLVEHGRIAMELARGCGSSAWVYSLLDEASWFVALYPEEAQEEVWGDDHDACAAGSLRPLPANRVERVDGGFRISGRYAFASGSDHASWVFVAGLIPPPGGDRPVPHYFLVPKSQLTMVDDWFVLGMRGTGSRSYVADDVFVPAHRVALSGDVLGGRMPGAALHPQWKLLKTPRNKVNPFIAAAPMAGLALGAVDRFRHDLGGVDGKAAGSQHLQLTFAEAAAEADCARLLVETGLAETMAVVERQEEVPDTLTARLLRDAAYVCLLSQRSVGRIHTAMGSAAVFEGHPVERALRDVNTGIAQGGVQWAAAAQPFASLALGMTLTWNPSGFVSRPTV